MYCIDHEKLYEHFKEVRYKRNTFKKPWQNDWWNLYWFLLEHYPYLHQKVFEIYDVWHELGIFKHKRI